MSKKKDKSERNTNKIVPFPNLHKRLIIKGQDELERKNYQQAALLFKQAREYDQENVEVNLGLLASFVELQRYEEARTLCNELLKQGIGDYFQIMSIYLAVLLQLEEHEEIVETIELLIQENQIPFDKMEHFEQMHSYSQKVLVDRQIEAHRQIEKLQNQLQQQPLFLDKSDQELLDIMTQLSHINVRPFLDEIRQFLLQEKGHPFFKTMLINILKEQDYDQPVDVKKFSKKKSIIPSQLLDLQENDFFKKVLMLTEEALEHQNPSLLEMVHSLFERHQFLLYPLEPEQDFATLAAAYHALAEEYMTGKDISDQVVAIYDTDLQTVRKCMTYLKEIEGISYPII